MCPISHWPHWLLSPEEQLRSEEGAGIPGTGITGGIGLVWVLGIELGSFGKAASFKPLSHLSNPFLKSL